RDFRGGGRTMGNWKYLALSSAMLLGLSAGLAGCPEDEETACSSSEDCVDDQACELNCCICFTTCATDADSTTPGETCVPVYDSTTASHCAVAGGGGGSGGSGGSGGGNAECDAPEDCLAESGFCDLGGGSKKCIGQECGDTENMCDRCA